jgi:hypothetical protein
MAIAAEWGITQEPDDVTPFGSGLGGMPAGWKFTWEVVTLPEHDRVG